MVSKVKLKDFFLIFSITIKIKYVHDHSDKVSSDELNLTAVTTAADYVQFVQSRYSDHKTVALIYENCPG